MRKNFNHLIKSHKTEEIVEILSYIESVFKFPDCHQSEAAISAKWDRLSKNNSYRWLINYAICKSALKSAG